MPEDFLGNCCSRFSFHMQLIIGVSNHYFLWNEQLNAVFNISADLSASSQLPNESLWVTHFAKVCGRTWTRHSVNRPHKILTVFFPGVKKCEVAFSPDMQVETCCSASSIKTAGVACELPGGNFVFWCNFCFKIFMYIFIFAVKLKRGKVQLILF